MQTMPRHDHQKPPGDRENDDMTLRESRPIKRYSEEWWAEYARPENRCVAHQKVEKGGGQCHLPARRGGTVCRFHGGAAPQVKAKARERLELAADRMARELLGIATAAESEAVKLSAVKDALDRAGLSAKTEVAVEVKQPWEELLGDVAQITKSQSDAIYHPERVTQAPQQALPPADDGIVDAEVVEDAPARPPDSTPRGREAPFWAEDTGEPPQRALATAEDAAAAAARANRAAKVAHVRRRR